MARIDTKWPRLLVAGEPVTPEQADDILLRTWGGHLYSNDAAWLAVAGAVMGIGSKGFRLLDWKAATECYEALGGLDLHYLHNSRIACAHILGPHGWCDWDGTIGCATYGIGKWPGPDQVLEDLIAIAAAWPFLHFRVQLVEDDGDGGLCGEWCVTGGQAMETEPGPRLEMRDFDEASVVSMFLNPGRERGVSLERLAAAYARVRAAGH
jgi:hypothetical protein